MAKSFYETIIASGGFAGENFDVAAGPANTGVIDTLLSAGDGTLTEDAPISVISTGLLNAARTLDLTSLEAADGRILLLSVRNSDISGVNTLTLLATTSINGFGPTTGFVIDEEKNYWLVHETGGIWRAYEQRLDFGAAAVIFRDTFAAADWTAGTNNQITILRTGAPAAGEIGPHNLMDADSYVIQVYRDSDDELVDTGVVVNSATGDITLTKTGLGADFDGRIIVVGD
jgi:hypothetical protein